MIYVSYYTDISDIFLIRLKSFYFLNSLLWAHLLLENFEKKNLGKRFIRLEFRLELDIRQMIQTQWLFQMKGAIQGWKAAVSIYNIQMDEK